MNNPIFVSCRHQSHQMQHSFCDIHSIGGLVYAEAWPRALESSIFNVKTKAAKKPLLGEKKHLNVTVIVKQWELPPLSAPDKAKNLSGRLSHRHTERLPHSTATWPHCPFCATEHHSCWNTHTHTHCPGVFPHIDYQSVCFLAFLYINPPLSLSLVNNTVLRSAYTFEI